MEATNREIEGLFPDKKRNRNPLVPIGALLTAGVLTAGLISFKKGNSELGQKLMRARVVTQGATVAIMELRLSNSVTSLNLHAKFLLAIKAKGPGHLEDDDDDDQMLRKFSMSFGIIKTME
nr:RING-H2 finger protein ATL48-like [Tanacetum cinerariifolium]